MSEPSTFSKTLQDHVSPVVGFSLTAIAAFVFNLTWDKNSWENFAWVILFSLLLYLAFTAIYSWFHLHPRDVLKRQSADHIKLFDQQRKEYETLHVKIKATVDKLIQRQRFIDQSMLSLIEKEAKDIWVITTKLANELGDEELREAVRQNLEKGKRYTYFLPDKDHPNGVRVQRNLSSFKKLDFYENFKWQIEFIRLPLDTHFLLEEVVIYNPEHDEDKTNDIKGINGFTYYEGSDEEPGKLHMKIEGELLRFLADSLLGFLAREGLHQAVEQILTEYSEVVGDQDKLYLVGLLKETTIRDAEAHSGFLNRLRSQTGIEVHAATIERILDRHRR